MSTPTVVPASVPAVSLDSFLNRLRAQNPFFVDRVDRPTADGGDVESIHAAAFAKITALARLACEQDRGVGAMLWGEAGIGKSHLLARLARWANSSRQAILISLPNLLCNPENLPRYVLKCCINVLTLGQVHNLHQTPLFLLVNGMVREAVGRRRTGFDWESVQPAYFELLDRLARQDAWRALLIDRTVFDVFYHFYESAHTAWRDKGDPRPGVLAVRWLTGDWLDPLQAQRIGIKSPANRPVRLEDEQHIKKVFVALAQMARFRNQPLVLCFDQVDNLDDAQLRSLARFLHDLLDSAGNLLIVTSGVQQTLASALQNNLIHKSAWDRMAQHLVELSRIPRDAARHMLESRLEKFVEPFLSVGEVKQLVQTDTLFPLGRGWFDRRVRDLVDVRPRDAINWARDRWESQQESAAQLPAHNWLAEWDQDISPESTGQPQPKADRTPAIDERIDAQLAHLRAKYGEQRGTLPPDAGHLATLVQTLLDQCRPPIGNYALTGMERTKPGAQQPYDLIVRQAAATAGQEPRIGMTVIVTSNGTAAAAALRRITENANSDRAFVVTDVREPLPQTPKVREYLEELRQRGTARFHHFELSFEEYAYLAGLRDVVSQARAGELEIQFGPGERRRISDGEAIASHHRRDRYRANRLLKPFLTPAGERGV